ncbi:MAG: MATE family efflux transporter [Candidatus Andeanibacterium colombiense]|uniref:MATE family efflux transporter n=1 Tax=Candidatus Andeanibacterium colombiense TaxID=3121345 RepID=A0AAJ6BNF5_9SPHN|nr:MAG: MATE family efflux transporter [Sphingomonadaceae bacterium]
MEAGLPPPPLTRRAVFAQSWPIMVGQASIPLVGLVDTVVIGRTGNVAALAGVALGAVVINLVLWSFGFLRMGMTGLTAQAEGAGNRREVEALLLRGLIAGFGIGALILLLHYPLALLAFSLLAGGAEVTGEAHLYVGACFLGAPAALAVFAITGWLFGLGRSRAALVLQLVMNLANIGLSTWLVCGLHLGAHGVGLAAAGAQWAALAAGLAIVTRVAGADLLALARRAGIATLFERAALARLFAVNRDLMIRTIALLLLLTWFANAGARLGTVALAANQVLMQFVNIAAFILDAFAFTAEARVGNAIGAGSRAQFLRAVRLTGEYSLGCGALMAVGFWLAGDALIAAITSDPELRQRAALYLPFAALVPLAGMPSWLLDGIFIGATRGHALRNAAVAATVIYVALDLALRPWGAAGLWTAFLLSYILRALTLSAGLPGLLKSLR